MFVARYPAARDLQPVQYEFIHHAREQLALHVIYNVRRIIILSSRTRRNFTILRFRGKARAEEGRARRFQNSAEDQRSAADTISVHEKKIRRVPTRVRATPTLTQFRTRPSCPRLPDPRPRFESCSRMKQATVSPTPIIFCSLSLSLLLKLLRMERTETTEKKEKGALEKNIRKNRVFTRSTTREIFSRKWIHRIYIYVYIFLVQDLSIRYRNLDPPFSVHDLLFRPAFAGGSFYAITLPTLFGKMGGGGRKEGGISRRKPGLKVARRLFARRES